jgi:membrane protease YdiL (CAAX protease family)
LYDVAPDDHRILLECRDRRIAGAPNSTRIYEGGNVNESVTTGQNRTRRSWVQSPVLAVCEFALIALIFWGDIHNHIFLSKTLYLFPLAWISLRVRGLRWKDIGLVRYLNWNKTLLVGVACGVSMELFELYVSQPLLMRWTGKPPDLELFRALHGNIKWTLIAIAGSWTLAAFGEEMVYRGYLLNRIAELRDSRGPHGSPV